MTRFDAAAPERDGAQASTVPRVEWTKGSEMDVQKTGRIFGWEWTTDQGSSAAAAAGGVLFFGPLLMILFRRKYPRWWFDWNRELSRFSNRVGVYLGLMDERYPATDEQQSVHLDIDYPHASTELNRWLPLVKWFLAIPHYAVLIFLTIGAVFAVIAAWFAILFTGRYPRGLRIRKGSHALAQPSDGLRIPACHRSLSTIPAPVMTLLLAPPVRSRR